MTLAAALLLAWLLDAAFGEPRNAWHPVAWLGQLLGPCGRWLSSLPLVAAFVSGALAPFFCARLAADPAALRRHGVKLRDAHSFGMPGWARLNALPPPAQAALWRALDLVG